MKQKILVARAIFPETIERLRQYFEVETNPDDVTWSAAELASRLADKAGALTAGDKIDATVLAGAPHLKVVANMAVGFNNFDLDAFKKAGVLGTNTPDVLNEATADFGWSLLMSTARRVTEAERYLRAGHWRKWSYDGMLGADVYGTTLGIIGMGRIGQAVARRARGFSMRVIYNNRNPVAAELHDQLGVEFVSKTTLLAEADHVMLVLPYTAASHHTIGAAELAMMKPTATLINLARGGIIDDAALIEALKKRQIGGAGLDVFEAEPNFNQGFLALDNVVLTPHIGSATESTRRAMAELAADNLIAGLGCGPNAGRPANPVNPEVWQSREVS